MSKTDYSKYLVYDSPAENKQLKSIKNVSSPPLYLMNAKKVPEASYNIEMTWVTGIPEPNPWTSVHVHDFNEVVLFIGGDCLIPEELGAEIEFSMGSDKLTVDSTGAIFVPAGVPHGQPTWKKLTRPHVRISIEIATGTSTSAKNEKAKSEKIMDFQAYHVKKPAYEVMAGTPVKGRQGPSSMTFMNNDLVASSNIYIEGGWVWDIPEPNPHIFEHVHDYEEMVIHYGSDYTRPRDLGAEIEFCVGGQALTIEKTSAVYVPSRVKHGPLTWKRYQFPHFEMAIMPGAGTLDQADPGGHIEKTRRNS